ncbi:MAG: sulfatase-like hydrolase/transferase [Kiritimatiellae bacterium]|nr:sulfatase-like hydrolase/transferase [Kiritimatiellia bacterium]
MRFAISICIGVAACALASASQVRPNILFILADDLGYGDVGFTWQTPASSTPRIHTPNLDKAARAGVILSSHYAAAPVCAPSRASLMSGRSQPRCSVRNNDFDSPLTEPDTLATLLKSQGYRTYAVGKWGIGGGGESGLPVTAHPLDKGFDEFYGFMDHLAGHTYYHYDGTIRNAWMGITENRSRANSSAEGIYSTDLFTAKTKQFIERHISLHPSEPFFIYLAINTIHGSGRLGADVPVKTPIHVPAAPYPPGGGLCGGVRWPLPKEPESQRNTYIDPAYQNRNLPIPAMRYGTAITRFDHAFGDLMQELADLHISTNTIVIFTSDNGPTAEYGTDPRFFLSAGPFDGEKRDVYEGGMRVPTFVWGIPGAAGIIDHSPSQSPDWMATLAALAHAPAPPDCDGVNLLARWTSNPSSAPASKIYTQYFFPSGYLDAYAQTVAARKGRIRGQQQMMRTGSIVALRTNLDETGADTPVRIYDVVEDPGQTRDLAPSHPGMAAEYQAILERQRLNP